MKKEAFTLIEMIIAITVFTIFIGFVMSSYIAFHRALQEASSTRSLVLEMESVLDTLSLAVKENTIDYQAYLDQDPSHGDALGNITRKRYFEGLFGSDVLDTNELLLQSPDAETHWIYSWDDEEKIFTVQAFDSDGNEKDGYLEPIKLHTDTVSVEHVWFRIFPAEDPFLNENRSNDDLQYQPIVTIDLEYSTPGRVREEISIDLHTSVTSRFYQ